eukprot:m.54100 g.54100  ORF g.54100 m.54100 type:complete len:420 (-) comp21866_c0_seq1:347-1606(-)
MVSIMVVNAVFVMMTISVSAGDPGKCLAPAALGCYVDPYPSPVGQLPVLNFTAVKNSKNMSLDVCVAMCCAAGYTAGSLAGLENGGDCHCGPSLGPYPVPEGVGCTTACTGNPTTACGGPNRIQVYSFWSCPAPSRPSFLKSIEARSSEPEQVQQCASGCTSCPAGDTCCIGKNPDPYSVPGGYGCSPPHSQNTTGCASGGISDVGCCCGPGPGLVSSMLHNVLLVGDSVTAGYLPYVQAALQATANVQIGPDNSGGGHADGSNYGRLCMPYFVRTPQYVLPSWDVITFNFGLHDGAVTNDTYITNMNNVTEYLIATAKATASGTKKAARLIYFLTTIPGGSNSVPGEPVSPSDKRVIELNAIATTIMNANNIPVVDLYATMTACGDACKACQPHCGPAGYKYLVENAIEPAIKKALQE